MATSVTTVECKIVGRPSTVELIDALKYAHVPKLWFTVGFTVANVTGSEVRLQAKVTGVRYQKNKDIALHLVLLHGKTPGLRGFSTPAKGTLSVSGRKSTLMVPAPLLG